MQEVQNIEMLKTMYKWLMSGYREVEQRLAKVQEENEHLKQLVRHNKNIHPFTD